MAENTESTADSFKYCPVPMSRLLEYLKPLHENQDEHDSSYTSVESDDSVDDSKNEVKKEKISSKLYNNAGGFKIFTSERKSSKKSISDKENDNPLSNQTYPGKSFLQKVNCNILSQYPNSDKKNNDNLFPSKNNPMIKVTPDCKKFNQRSKLCSPYLIKPGIRKFTPTSGQKSVKKTPQKMSSQKKESVRCLFHNETPNGPAQQSFLPPPVFETPANKTPAPVPVVATPSYPQGIINYSSKRHLKSITIKEKQYMYIKKLGSGGSSEVFKVLEVGTSNEYALKCVSLATDQELAQGYVNEVRLLRKLQDSDRVIKLYDYEYNRVSRSLSVLMEVGDTDLVEILRRHGDLTPELVLHYWKEMLQAVNHIHEKGVIHADLKPGNFVLVRGRLKLIDFGIASAVSSDATSVVRAQATGTYSYISPEALMGGAGGAGGVGAAMSNAPIKISFKSDVWSLGCILYSMVYGRTPFGHLPNLAKIPAILDSNHTIQYAPVTHLPLSLMASLRACLTYNARARPTVRELLAEPHLTREPCTAPPLPIDLLDQLSAHVTPAQLELLRRARIH